MSTANVLVIGAINSAHSMLTALTADLSPADYLHRPCAKGNCAAWIVGHLVLSARAIGARLGAVGFPDLPEGFEKRFARDEAAPAAAEYGDVSILVPLLKTHTEAIVAAVEKLADEKLMQALEKPHPMFQTMGGLAAFVAIHTATHAGHISTIRRTLGRAPLI